MVCLLMSMVPPVHCDDCIFPGAMRRPATTRWPDTIELDRITGGL